ncbi:MAG TPA: RidA family protein [Blastocatellia bacterium]|nr:RidA family protein [Blastocatellia bacterium]
MPINPRARLFNPEMLSKPMGYSHAAEVSAGRTIYIAGQVSLDASGQLVGEGDFAAQVQQVFKNLKAAVEAAGGTFSDVVKMNIYCVDRVERSQLPALRTIRDQFVNTEAPPVSTLIFIRDLVRPEWLIEIDAVAVAP